MINTCIDSISCEGILKYICCKNIDITVLDSVDSTNAYLKTKLTENLKEGTVIIARTQTAGRGRFSRKFYSPQDTGIYMSIFLKPCLPPEYSVLITSAAAVAVSEACENLSGKNVYIKWVNDVIIDSKKVCGILTEGVLNPQNGLLESAILGIGVNAYVPQNDFDEEIKGIAGAVFDDVKPDLRNQLCAEILERFMKYYSQIKNKTFLDSYRKRSCVLGKEITVHKGDLIIPATAIEIDNSCRLLVKYKDNTLEHLSSGEISIKLRKEI